MDTCCGLGEDPTELVLFNVRATLAVLQVHHRCWRTIITVSQELIILKEVYSILMSPLWDGMNCNNVESPWCTNNQLPWFNTTLSDTTNDDLELRLLFSSAR